MSRQYVIADLHLGHEKVLEFESEARPFSSIDEHDETLIANINEICGRADILVIAGDIAIHRRNLDRLSQIRARKILVGGNHDDWRLEYLAPHFEKIVGSLSVGGALITHIPVHPDCLGRRWYANIHGHIHSQSMNDGRYFCVSVEHTGMRPLLLADVIKRIKSQ